LEGRGHGVIVSCGIAGMARRFEQEADPYGMTTRNANAKAEAKVAETDGVWGHLR
jgi:hypothetical protein